MIANQNVKMINLDYVYPIKRKQKNNVYQLVASFYVAYRKNNKNPNIKTLVNWILSNE